MKLYHLSDSNLHGKTIKPRIPNNYMTKNGFEDNKTPRVSFAKTIDGCLRGMSQKLDGKEFYVHIPDSRYNTKDITNKEVPDQSITGEIWIVNDIRMKCIGSIRVISDKGEEGIPYVYGDHKAELYDWNWEWVDNKSKIKESVGKCQQCGKSRDWDEDGTSCTCGHDHIVSVSVNESGIMPDIIPYDNSFNKISDINESYFINNTDIILNLDKWDTKRNNNILFITGLSGSGKTTIASKYEREYNAYMFEIDGIEHNYDSTNRNILKKAISKHHEYEKYINNKWEGLDVATRFKYIDEIFFTALQIMKDDYNTLYIVEGLQLYNFIPIETVKNKPLIIKGTSALVSLIRRIGRGADNKNIISEIIKEFPKLSKYYYDNERNLKKYKKNIIIKESLITDKEYTLNDIINIREKDITKSLLIELFGNFDSKPKYNPSDLIIIPPGKYGTTKKNKNEFTTTIGIWLFNKYCIEPTLFDVLGYINENVHGKVLDKINKSLSYAILENMITIHDMKPYLMKQQHLMRLVSVLAPNHSMKMLKTSTHIDKKRKELIAKNKEELDAGNEIISAEIEKELVDYALDYLGDDDSLDMYNSKARGSIGNNFKNMFIMRGAIMNPDPNKGFDIATSNLIDGISKDEYAIMANSLVAGAYAKAKNTATGGHMAKLYINAFQHVILDKHGSDCKTKRYIDVTLDSSVIDNYMYSYIISGQSLIELNSKNKDKYLNKKVKLRYSSMCESKTGICNMCAGNLFYTLEKTNIGMVTVIIANKVMLLSMKKFHDQTVKLHDMDIGKAFGL